MKDLDKRTPEGWVLYDGACGLCSRWVPYWERTLKKRGYSIAPLQSDWVGKELHLSDEDLASDFRLFLAAGEQLAGAEATALREVLPLVQRHFKNAIVRGDSDFDRSDVYNAAREEGAYFAIGGRLYPNRAALVEAISEKDWQPFYPHAERAERRSASGACADARGGERGEEKKPCLAFTVL